MNPQSLKKLELRQIFLNLCLPFLVGLTPLTFLSTAEALHTAAHRPPPLPHISNNKVNPVTSSPSLAVAPPRMPGLKPPGIPGSCLPAGTMPVNADTCQITQSMCGCDKFPHDPKVSPNRRRVDASLRKPFSQKAPGLEQYSQLGYCTGVYSGATYSGSSQGGTSSQLGVRSYTLRLRQMTEPKTGRLFLKAVMDDQPDEKTDRMKSCSAPSQVEAGVKLKNRPTNAPPLFFVEGETAQITVINETEIHYGNASKDILTAIHWHGIILPNDQDGIADITQAAIPPGGQKIYRFTLQQSGTYWYHPHDLNEQDTRGALIIFPNPNSEGKLRQEFGGVSVKYHQDRVIMLTDYKERKTLKILNYLRDEDRNAYETDSRIHKGWLNNLECAKEYLENFKMMKMFWMDRADVWYDSFLMNDETCLNCGSKTAKIETLHTEYPGQTFQRLNEFSNIQPGERVRLRIINSSASSYFFLDYANSDRLAPNQKLDMLIVAKDGLPIKPTYVDQLYMGMGETYDVLVEVPEDGTLFELRAKSIDDITNGRAARTLIGHNPLNQVESDQVVAGRNVPVQICGPYPEVKDQINQVNYSQLEAPDALYKANLKPRTNNDSSNVNQDLKPFEIYHREKPIARYSLALSGSMEDYHWKIDGVSGTKLQTDSMHMLYMTIKEDYRIRVTIENAMMMGMMNHPWHLHGNWFRLIKEGETDDQIAKKALLHTATIFPGQKVTLEFYADPEYRGAWMFHCHNMYHMANDMMMYLRYDTVTDSHMEKLNHHQHNSSVLDKILPGAIQGLKNQYVVAGVGTNGGTEGLGASAQVRYRGTLGDNMGFIDFNTDISAGNLTSSNKRIEIASRLKHCFAVDKCVFLDFRLQQKNNEGNEKAIYVGGQYKVWNSDLLVLESGAGSLCQQSNNDKSVNCSPALKNNASTMIDAGWNTKVTGKVGCEGVYCGEFFGSLQVSVTANPRITVLPINCKVSTNMEETACMAEVRIITDPVAFGRQ